MEIQRRFRCLARRPGSCRAPARCGGRREIAERRRRGPSRSSRAERSVRGSTMVRGLRDCSGDVPDEPRNACPWSPVRIDATRIPGEAFDVQRT